MVRDTEERNAELEADTMEDNGNMKHRVAAANYKETRHPTGFLVEESGKDAMTKTQLYM